MKITKKQLKEIIKEEIVKESRFHIGYENEDQLGILQDINELSRIIGKISLKIDSLDDNGLIKQTMILKKKALIASLMDLVRTYQKIIKNE